MIADGITVNLTRSAADSLKSVIELTEESKTDAIARALRLYAMMCAIQAEGGAIYVQKPPEHELEKVILI